MPSKNSWNSIRICCATLGLPFASLFRGSMSPEELNRTIDFIIQSQARLAAAHEQDKEWAKGLFAQMAAQDQRLGELIEIQSRRLDEYEKEQRIERRAAEKRHGELIKLLSE